MIGLLLCGFTVFLPFLHGEVTLRPEITLNTGVVRGWRLASKATNNTYLWAFKGIPYAKPPLKDLRFKAPLTAEKWTSTLDLSANDPKACAQNGNQISGEASENCLFVNVYTPEDVNKSSVLPVMVWIHGGAFVGGSSASSVYGGDYLVEQRVVFVTMNYRVGALGFLNLGTDEVPGNAGLKDQRMALQWVQDEILSFGGDPRKVTIFGQSAGSASVIMHFLSPKSAGLFSGAIAESGNIMNGWAFMSNGFDERAKSLSEKLNCSGSNLTCLQNAKVEDIIKYQDLQLTDNEYIPGNSFVFVPTLERSSDSAFLSDTPDNLITSFLSSGNKLPLLTGVSRDEGLGEISSDPARYQELPAKLKYFIPKDIREKKSEEQIKQDVASIYSVYFNNTLPSLTNLDGFVKIYTDKMFVLAIAMFARKIAKLDNTFLYHFDYDGGFKQQHTSAMEMGIKKGINHGDELGYIFVREDLNQSTTAENTTEKKTLRKMVALWTNFAKYGNPTPNVNTTSILGNLSWTAISEGAIRYMRVTEEGFAMSTDDFQQDAVTFWEKIESTSSFGTTTKASIFFLPIIMFGNMICNL